MCEMFNNRDSFTIYNMSRCLILKQLLKVGIQTRTGVIEL